MFNQGRSFKTFSEGRELIKGVPLSGRHSTSRIYKNVDRIQLIDDENDLRLKKLFARPKGHQHLKVS